MNAQELIKKVIEQQSMLTKKEAMLVIIEEWYKYQGRDVHIANPHEKEDFIRITRDYGMNKSIECYNKGGWYLIGENYDSPMLIENGIKGMFEQLLPSIAECYENDPRDYLWRGLITWYDIIKILLDK